MRPPSETTRGGSGLVSVRRQGMQEDGRPGCLLGTTEEAHGESRAGEGAGVGARGGLGGRSAPWRWRWVGSACRRKGRSTVTEGRAGHAGAAEKDGAGCAGGTGLVSRRPRAGDARGGRRGGLASGFIGRSALAWDGRHAQEEKTSCTWTRTAAELIKDEPCTC